MAERKPPSVPVLFLAYCSGFGAISISNDPKRQVVQWQEGNPQPIEMVTIFRLTTKELVNKADALLIEFLESHHWMGIWFKAPKNQAVWHMIQMVRCLQGENVRFDPPVARARYPERRRAIRTPDGLFPSAAAAGAAHGITRQAAHLRASRGIGGWKFEDAN